MSLHCDEIPLVFFVPSSFAYPASRFFLSHYFPVRIPDTDEENKRPRGTSGLGAPLVGLRALLHAFEWEIFAGDREFWAPCACVGARL